ncbi:MAG: hypothetical protein HQL17_08485 [Candidatus Omnitrophica bacterium]|nr:hypothetical protein [Candidatus Omnitrophota bacterium]
MEKALLLQRSDILKAKRDSLSKYDAVYIGSDFCPHLMPSVKEVQHLRKVFDKKIVLATPVLTTQGVAGILRFIRRRSIVSLIDEMVVNDWGLLHKINSIKINVSVGLLMMYQLQRLSKEQLSDFFAQYRVKAIELDEIKYIENIPANTKISLHYPLRFLCFARFCPHVKKIPSSCRQACYGKTIALKASHGMGKVYLIANAYFIKNKERLDRARLSRLVTSPVV